MIKKYLFLHFTILLYTGAMIVSKLASAYPLFSWQFFLLYGAVLAILLIFAILWQKVLKLFPLNTALANKAVTILWGFLWAAVIFAEQISVNMIVGSAVVLVGIMFVIWGNYSEAKKCS